MENARITQPGNAKPVLTGDIYDRESFAPADSSGSIDLGHYQTDREENYQMAVKAEASKTKGQTYYEEVEELKASGMSNADAIRQVAKKHGANENAVRGGIHQYRSRHADGSSPRRGRRSSATTVEDYVANARKALEAARDLIDREVEQAKSELATAQKRYDDVVASVSDRKADIENKLKALL
jgi:uncharacterized protein YoaH (UPF0181 family)